MDVWVFTTVLNRETIGAIKSEGFEVLETRTCPNGGDHGKERRIVLSESKLEILELLIKFGLPSGDKRLGLPFWGEHT